MNYVTSSNLDNDSTSQQTTPIKKYNKSVL